MSGYVELLECDRPTSESAYHGLVDWFKRFGVVRTWVSDQGSHFTSDVMELVRYLIGAQHHFVTAYSPWANGTVEVVHRLILRCMKALASELKLQPNKGPVMLPLVQAALNGLASDRLGSITPVTEFTGLPGSSQLTSILSEPFAEICTLSWGEELQKRHLTGVRVALDTIHQQSATISERRNVQARGRHAAKPGVRIAKFSLGDFVLAATAIKGGSKFSLHWRGPKRVMRSFNDYTFEVQDICAPYAVTIRHASWLKFYRDAGRGVTEDLIAHALHGKGGHLVEKLLGCKWGQQAQQWKISVQWMGLDADEASWEPASVIFEDVRQLVRKFVAESRPDHLARRMWTKLSPKDPIDEIELRQPVRGRRKRRSRLPGPNYSHRMRESFPLSPAKAQSAYNHGRSLGNGPTCHRPPATSREWQSRPQLT